jgi:1-acyl-sn-glycerol-3-phosphate acyltransferase
MAAIDRKGLLYRLLKRYVTGTFKQFYSEYIILGKENIPSEGKAIYGSNHLNALMDALAILSIVPNDMSIVFLARADIFGNKLAARLLRFVKILPAYRIRNGYENLGKNAEIFEQCAGVLNRGNCIGIMPEGYQTLQHKIRPLVKGIFRIAFTGQEKAGKNASSIKLIPAGIDMGDLINPGGHIIMEIGEAVNVADYMQAYRENPATAINQLRADYRQRLKDVTVDYDTDKYYDCFESTGNILNLEMVKRLQLDDTTVNRYKARKEIAKRLVALEKENHGQIEELTAICKEYTESVKTLKLSSLQTPEKEPETLPLSLARVLLQILTLPVALTGLALSGPAFFAATGIRKALNFKSKEFFSSVHYFLGILITFPAFYVLNTVLFACFSGLAWWWTLLFFFSQYPFGKFAFYWYKRLRSLGEQFRYRKSATQNPSHIDNLKLLRKCMAEIVLPGC